MHLKGYKIKIGFNEICLLIGSLLILIGFIRLIDSSISISSTSFGADFYTHAYKGIVAVVVALVILIVDISIYNAKHCSRSSCKNASVSVSKYCYTHKCSICKQPKSYNSNYCYLHKTLYDGGSGTSTGSVYSDLKFTNIRVQHNSLYTVVTGTVTDYGSRSYKFVTIKGAFKSASGTVLDTDSTYAVGSEGLSKGESKTFRMSIDKNYSVSKCDIYIISYK